MRIAEVIAIVLLGTATAWAAPAAATALEELQTHLREQDYDLVVEAADRVLTADPTRAQRAEALRFKGEALVVLGKKDDAVAVFDLLFSLDPDAALPEGTSPNVLAVFDAARAVWSVEQEARLQTELGAAFAATSVHVALPEHARGGRPIGVAIDLADPQHITEELVVSYRHQGDKHWSTLTSPARTGRVTLSIPGAVTASRTPYQLEIVVRARHHSGMTLRHDGTLDHPLVLAVAAGTVPSTTPVTRRWWFWTGVSALAVAAVSIPILVDRSRDVGEQTVIIRSPSLVVGRW